MMTTMPYIFVSFVKIELKRCNFKILQIKQNICYAIEEEK